MERMTTARCSSLLKEYQALTKELIHTILLLSRGQSKDVTPEDVMKKLIEKDRELQKAVKESKLLDKYILI
jgi:hypothetical protein